MLKKIAARPGFDGIVATIKVIGLIAFTVWIANFLNFRELGLYEDDYFHIPPVLGQSWSFLPQAFIPFLTWIQGRPVSYSIVRLLPFLGDQLGGISGIHIINFLLISCNAYLCYRILRKLTLPGAAIAGTLVFCLFPLDGAKILLSNSIIIQSTLGFLMGATLAYLMGKKWIAYGLILGSLLSYETAFMVFFGAPLLHLKKWDRALIKELVRHFLILALMIGVVVIIRKITGEGGDPRVNTLLKDYSLEVFAFRLLSASFIGTFANILSLVQVPYESFIALIRGDRNWLIVIVYFFVCLTVLATFKDPPPHEISLNSDRELTDFNVNRSLASRNTLLNKGIQQILYPTHTRLILVGVILLVLSYTLTFIHYYPPNSPWVLYGRLSTGAHGGAIFSCSVLFAGLYAVFLSLWQNNRRRIIATTLLSAYLALLVSYFFFVQLEFVKSWQYQRDFWSDVVKLCPDLDAGTMILVDSTQLPQTTYVLTYSWSDYLILQDLFTYPPNASKPSLFVVEGPDKSFWNGFEWKQGHLDTPKSSATSSTIKTQGLQQNLQQEKDQLFWRYPLMSWIFKDGLIPLPSSNTIVLKMVDGQLTRLTGEILADGKPFQLKKMPSNPGQYLPKGVLYDYLF